jgi:hypothetical protein
LFEKELSNDCYPPPRKGTTQTATPVSFMLGLVALHFAVELFVFGLAWFVLRVTLLEVVN